MTLIKELKIKRQIKGINIIDGATVIGATLFSWAIRGIVAAKLQIPFIIYTIIVSIICVLPSKNNPGKKIWQCFFYALKKDRKIYKPITVNMRSDYVDEY